MKIVIDIPEEVKQAFDNANNEDLYGNYYDSNSLIGKAIQNGIPLPKGHDRLVEARAVVKALFDKKTIYDVPTIIEADKEN